MGTRSDFSINAQRGGAQISELYSASKKSTWGNSWATSRDNQDQKIYIGTTPAYVTKQQFAMMQEMENEGWTLTGANGQRITLTGVGSESIPHSSRLHQAVGEAGERALIHGANRTHDAIEQNFRDSGAFRTTR